MATHSRSRHALAAALLAASLALAGCGSGSDSGAAAKADRAPQAASGQGPDSGYAQDGSAAREEGAGAGAGAAAPGAKKPAAPRQHIIRTAELSVEVEDADKALARVRDVAAAAGGHIAGESTERHGRKGAMTSEVVLRVPQDAYESVLKSLTGTGKLLSRKADAKDVTDQVVDVESRIATQRASVDRVRKLMDQATRLDDVVTLERELSSRQADLESLLAQQASLKDRTSLATITLRVTEPGAPVEPEKDEDPGVLDALSGGWNALVTSLTWFVVVLAALAPWLAVLALLYVVWRRVIRPWRVRRLEAQFRPPVVARATAPAAASPAGTPAASVPPQPQAQAQAQAQPEETAAGPDAAEPGGQRD
ncbi:DUF4349 domain-containing protein [Streptomyces sp. TRM64462]|uniref:DUF4349 domain-containing protein n=1 Tax=Streptomyces sp. TRM64462 TaxID=2741726 RepID=UPI001586DAFF|nr:DUF4349 domain-containing protein [Streptomyces sp. TRM64462]